MQTVAATTGQHGSGGQLPTTHRAMWNSSTGDYMFTFVRAAIEPAA